ncbi:MAG TPA: magnesium transporter [Syntrophomonadaceae bacterium]|nr:magnesium transporter [Syntrophomonadaceae bacterium]HOQ09176.1 magnesium transporter [Syntrophomonadaceae bacterium]HPU48577.1 magnesium transporter [Syntrophomonadaceae bacterium]
MLERDMAQIQELINQQQWSELRDLFSQYPVPDIADLLMRAQQTDRVLLFRLLPRAISSDVFSYLESEDQNEILKGLTHEETRNLLLNLRPDDRTVLFEELPGRVTQKLLNLLTPEELEKTRLLLGYPEESVGRLMTPDYVAVRPEWTVGEALDHIRKKGRDSETLNIIYVTDTEWKLMDAVELHRFILADPRQKVAELMSHSVISISAFEDREEAVHMMLRYDILALPVVDSEGVLLGVVTFDDVMDVAQAEATEDFHKGAAVTPLKGSYRETGIWELYKSRIVWLLGLVVVNLLSLELMAYYEELLASTIALTFFIPLLLGSGGNTGSQSSTIMVRGLATGDIEVSQWAASLAKELIVGLALGLTMGLAGVVLGTWKGGLTIALIVGLTMLLIIVVANLIGVILPLVLTKLDLDPAVASNPLITSITDATGLLIFFAISRWILVWIH